MPPSLLEAIRQLIDNVPVATVAPLVEAIASAPSGDWTKLRADAQEVLAERHYQAQVGGLIGHWQALAPELNPKSMAMVLQAAAYCAQATRQSQALELVWTGPHSSIPLRRTDQALLELLNGAKQEVLIVSFAIYNVPSIKNALVRAAQRGVSLTVVIESPQESAGKIAYDGLASLGTQVAERARIYRWPFEKRAVDSAGKHGALHVKCAVADSTILFLSSANLTQYALELNMEMGLLVKAGPLPRKVAQHFTHLVENDVLVWDSRTGLH